MDFARSITRKFGKIGGRSSLLCVLLLFGCGTYNDNCYTVAKGNHSYNLTDFSGGLNDSKDPMDVGPNQLSAVQNMMPDGKSIKRRQGFERYPATAPPDPACRGLFESKNPSKVIGAFDSVMYSLEGTTWTSRKTGLSSSGAWNFINYNQLVLATNAFNTPMKSSDGVVWSDMGGSPPTKARYIAEFNNYIWLANGNTSSDTSRAWFSGLRNPDSWDTTNDWIEFGTGDGHRITGMAVAADTLVVFKSKGIWEVRYTGNAALPFVVNQAVTSIGAYDGTVEVVDGRRLIFAGPSGVYAYMPGQEPVLLSEKIENTYKSLMSDTITGAASGKKATYIDKGKYYILGVNFTTNWAQDFLVYHLPTNSWWKWITGVSGFKTLYITKIRETIGNQFSSSILWIGAETSAGATLSWNPREWTDASEVGWDIAGDGTTKSAIVSNFTTPAFSWGRPDIRKRFTKSTVWGDAIASSNIAVTFLPDGDDTGTSVGNIDLFLSGASSYQQRMNFGGYANCNYGRLKFAQTGSTSANDSFKVDSIGIEAQLLGVR